MKYMGLSIVATAVLLSGCSTSESYGTRGNTYVVGDKNIALLKWFVLGDRLPMQHGSGKTLKAAYFPFIYRRTNGVLIFERYCTPHKMQIPIISDEERQLQSVDAVEKSCGLKGVKVVDRGIAGFPDAQNNKHGGISFSAMVMSPKTGKWEEQILFIDKPSKPSWW